MYFKNINATIAPASLTKLMTSLILIENYNLSDYIEISLPSDYIYEGKVAYLKSGQKMTIESLLEFILIYSANDACFAVVQLFNENTDDFLALMNKRAKQLGMNNTNFKNPDGLDQDGHYTTLSDLLILSKEVIDNYELLSIIMRKSFISNIEGEDKVYLNTNKLIERNFYGLKTGWTNEAGLTFIGLNQSNDRNILTIVNKSFVNEKKDNHFVDTQNLYSASIDTFINNVVIDNNVDIYKIRNNFETLTFKSTAPWFVFGNKLDISNITLNEFSETKFNYVVNEDLYNVRISDSVNSVKWDFNLSNFFSFFANNNL
jgi:D-alanyl-D-alanine carboxypeptidase